MKIIHLETATEAKRLTVEFEQKLKEYGEAISKLALDRRFTPEGKQEFISTMMGEVAKTCEQYNTLIKKLVEEYCEYMAIEMPDKPVDDTAVANALKIIDMTGYNLTGEILRTAIEPIKDSFKTVRMIENIISVKESVKAFPMDVHSVLRDCTYQFSDVHDYLDMYDKIKGFLDIERPLSYQEQGDINGSFSLAAHVPYSTLVMPNWIYDLGVMYSRLESKYPLVFTKHIPTEDEA